MKSTGFEFHYILHSTHLIEERLRTKLSVLGITHRQARVLDVLARIGQASQVQLADELELSPASMSTMTSRLLTASLIEKRVDEQELRSNILKLSAQGDELMDKIYAVWNEVNQEIEEVIGADKAKQLATITLALRNGFGGFTPGAKSQN